MIAETLDLVVETTEDFPAVLSAIFAKKFTGSVIIHFKNGSPAVVEIPSHQIRVTGSQPRSSLDTRRAFGDTP